MNNLKTHFSTTMSGTGAAIEFDDATYNIDAAKLSTATNNFIAHLGTIAGSGEKVTIGGVEYGIDSSKVSGAIADLDMLFNSLQPSLAPGLYDVNDNLIASWSELIDTYGMDAQTNYARNNFKTRVTSPYYILTNNDELASGVKLVIDINMGAYTCSTCPTLTSVAFLDNVTAIPSYFCNSSNLTEISFSKNSQVNSIGASAFYNTKITSITIPKSVTSIGKGAFSGCTSLASINIAEDNVNYKSIDGNLYNYAADTLIQCAGGKTNITIPEGVTTMGDALSYCSNLTNVILPRSLMDVQFFNCTNLRNITFNGTITQWETLQKGTNWNLNVPATHVQCSDGTVAL